MVMKILFLTLSNIENIESNGLYTDLVRKFNEQHEMYIVCPREKRLNKKTCLYEKLGIKFLCVNVGNITKTNFIEKGISTLLMPYKIGRSFKMYFKSIKFDLILYSTPPITLEKLIRKIKYYSNSSTYLLLKDIDPQAIVDLEIIHRNGIIYNLLRKKEKNLYKISDYIGCMSQANVNYLLNHNDYLDKSKVEICPNSIEPLDIIKDIDKVNLIRQKYNIPKDRIIFIYGGNLGKPQGIDFLLECLKSNINNNKVYFIIAGSGTEFNKISNFVENINSCNVRLFSQLPKDEYEILANSCDVGLIFLDKRFTIPNFPSRLLSYMQASMPILAVTDKNTDVGKVIVDGKFGLWSESGNLESFNEKLDILCSDELREKMGNNSRKYLEDNYTVNHSYEIIMKHFKNMEAD